MKVLTDLDSIQLDESQTSARSKRKSMVNSTNANMDGADENLRRTKNLIDKQFKTSSDHWTKILTSLDSIQVDESETLARKKINSQFNQCQLGWRY